MGQKSEFGPSLGTISITIITTMSNGLTIIQWALHIENYMIQPEIVGMLLENYRKRQEERRFEGQLIVHCAVESSLFFHLND